MAKTKFQLADVGDILGKQIGAFQDPPKIAAPNTTILGLDGQPRQMPDPSKTLRPAMGIERIHSISLSAVGDEKGPNGEAVYELQNKDTRVRFVGKWITENSGQGSCIISSNPGDFVEITFYGTGINFMTAYSGDARDLRASIDGAVEGSNLYNTGSSIIASRGYRSNQLTNAVSGLSLDTHTVKLRYASGVNWRFLGFEILNENTQIDVSEGEAFGNGKKYPQSALETTAYNSGFDGSPTLNGRGGRVMMYKLPNDETVYKAIQQTDNSQGNLGAADHSNESLIHKINWREFGVNRSAADDFSNLSTTPSNRAFTLDDGTTTLVGENVRVVGGVYLNFGQSNTSHSLYLTFVGTGLDVTWNSSGTTTSVSVDVDGSNIGTFGPAAASGFQGLQKIISGLPYGTHVVKFSSTNTTDSVSVFDLLIYGPKKPTIPDEATEIGEYYLMGDYSHNSTELPWTISQGTLRKNQTIRETVFVGAGWVTPVLALEEAGGFRTATTTSGDNFEFTFYGTGFDFKFGVLGGRSNDVRITLDDHSGSGFQILNTTNFSTAAFATSPSVTYDSVTLGTLDQDPGFGANGASLSVSNLPLGLYTVKMTNNVAAQNFVSGTIDIHTPIHFPNTKIGSLSVGSVVEVKADEVAGGVDLSKAKAWIVYDQSANEILSSYNISAVVDAAAGESIHYFEKPFKTPPAIVAMRTGSSGGGSASIALIDLQSGGGAITIKPTHAFQLDSQFAGVKGDSSYISVVCFGELQDKEE